MNQCMNSLLQATPPADVADAGSPTARLPCSQGTHAILRDRGGDLLPIITPAQSHAQRQDVLEFPLGFAGHEIGHGAGLARSQDLTEVLHLLSK